MTNIDDPVALFAQGEISENILQRRLEEIPPEETETFDTAGWCRFLMEINETEREI